MKKQHTSLARRCLVTLLLSLAVLAACQGLGRVHEAPLASYPEQAPAEAPRVELPAPAEEFARAPSVEPEASSATDVDEPASKRSAAGAPSPGYLAPAAPEAKDDRAAALERGSQHARGWDDGDSALEPRRAPQRRPGLGTHWGESRYSPAREVDFARSDAAHPSATIELHYNDRAGARRMLPNGSWGRAEASALGGLRVRIVDAGGNTFPALALGSRVIGVGAPGERYALEIDNPTGARFEVVASVDGLDVLDGQDANFDKRGYLIGAYSSVSIDGFRRSESEVAAFRLGDVARSYAASQGKARNVGVIGFALFEERRPVVAVDPPSWRRPAPDDDTFERQSADPFPGRYARPPVW